MGFGSFTDPLITGGGALIRALVKSVNYVAGVSGWILNKDGSAEFSNATVRGSVSAGGGTVVLNSNGVKVVGPLRQYDINVNGGFLMRLVPDDGTAVQIVTSGATAGIFFTPTNPSANGTAYPFAGRVVGSALTTGAKDQGQLNMFPAIPTGKTTSSINMLSQGSNSATDDSLIQLYGNRLTFNDIDMGAGVVAFDGAVVSLTGVNATETVQLIAQALGGGSYTYKAGRVYRVVVTGGVITGAIATAPLFRIRKNSTAGQQFDAFRAPCQTAGSSYPAHYECYFQVGAANVTADIVLTLTGQVAPGTCTLTAAVTSPATITVYDDSPAIGTARTFALPTLV